MRCFYIWKKKYIMNQKNYTSEEDFDDGVDLRKKVMEWINGYKRRIKQIRSKRWCSFN
jgi:hypothetical protein